MWLCCTPVSTLTLPVGFVLPMTIWRLLLSPSMSDSLLGGIADVGEDRSSCVACSVGVTSFIVADTGMVKVVVEDDKAFVKEHRLHYNLYLVNCRVVSLSLDS